MEISVVVVVVVAVAFDLVPMCLHRMLVATCEERVPLALWCRVELSLGFPSLQTTTK